MVVRSRRTRKGSNRGHKKRSYRRNYRKYNRKSNTRKKSKKSNMRKTRKMKGGMIGTGVTLGARRGSSRGPALEPEPELILVHLRDEGRGGHEAVEPVGAEPHHLGWDVPAKPGRSGHAQLINVAAAY